MIYVVKIPVISGFQDKAINYEIVLLNSSDFVGEGITLPLDMNELVEVIQRDDESWMLNDFEFVGDYIENYSEAQWRGSQKLRIGQIKLGDIYPKEQWDYFCSGLELTDD
ncbi:hypothetical protein H6G54_12125 [Anabaena cylindrica FACHB-243]|uniref:Uncharacterized protein n=1 Tax=Anabaena cylindrica (strain ATCC 27899 / PCC 7122) TaxID=272123 RepID=K9ZDT0_ANACC|nr:MULTISPECIES: hypothetical protein [Anabaena]AFZ56899.1 hypothetical protein Anacy_1388 [Anabaena cylindrica PCC 7122]MBD2418430.1 hypothetical protein [Anabaena cylindrica FACHB-243]MBY5284887.1 hypothetical protein [Anabaena sp. CCAP 1446/1C]MBY5307653.1 hypothetical protein [Anabaena sp. CCAP 1446/1C]MCM2409385.1 hypothetical protein [Anabaena sp. CCAP 1446/1C]